MIYFAYGSNMLHNRISSRVPSAKFIGIAKLINKQLVCNKKSNDGSGKANLIDKEGNVTWGVLFDIEEKEIRQLDKFEKDYKRISIKVYKEDETVVLAQTYLSDKLTDDPRPYENYKSFIVEGACEHRLPEAYINFLKQLPIK